MCFILIHTVRRFCHLNIKNNATNVDLEREQFRFASK